MLMNNAINAPKKHVVEIKATLIYRYVFIDAKLMTFECICAMKGLKYLFKIKVQKVKNGGFHCDAIDFFLVIRTF